MDERKWPLLELTRTRMLVFVRRPGAVFWVFIFPMLMAVVLGVAFRNRPADQARVAVERETAQASRVIEILGRAEGVDAELMSADRARRALRRGRVELVIAPAAAGAKRSPAVTYVLDPTRQEARIARRTVDDILQRGFGRHDVMMAADRPFTEPGARYIDFLIPGLVGLNLMGAAMWGIGFAVVQTRTRKLLKRYAATPMHRWHFLLSFMLSRVVFLLPEVAFLFGFGRLAFGTPLRGSPLAVGAIALVGALSFTGMAVLVGSRPRSEESVQGWMNLVMMPMWLLGGSFFSYERFPELLHPVIRALPLTAVNDALRAVVNDGASLASVWSQLAILLAWGAVSFVVGLKIFRWQ